MGTRNKLKKINELKEQIKELKKQQDQLKSEVISEMGRKKSMTVGKFMAVWKERVKGFQSKELKEAMPEVYEEFYCTTKTKWLDIVSI